MSTMTRPRRSAAPPDTGNRCALLRWQGREGNRLLFTVASRSAAGTEYRGSVHLVTRAVTCNCKGHTTHGACWHAAAALEGAWRYEETLEVQRTLDSDWLAQQVDVLAPSQLGGVVALAWLAAKRVLAERTDTTVAA